MLPEFESDKFQCPHCRVIATQQWFSVDSASEVAYSILEHIFYDYRTRVRGTYQDIISSFIDDTSEGFRINFKKFIPQGFSVATCGSCNEISLWVNKEIKYPKATVLPPPNEDLDTDIKELYAEASIIFLDSPKGATALLRLALQKLLKQVGKSGKNINNDIKELVAEGLSPKIQQALDLLRVIGNNAVHPGQINIDDNGDIAKKLFSILNFIADELLTKPKELENLYADIIHSETKGHIEQRDKT